MAYIEKTIIAGEHIFKEKSFSARYGKKNIPRGPNWNECSEVQRRRNELLKKKRIVWNICTNFKKSDWWVTLTYRRTERPDSMVMAKKQRSRFISRLREKLKKKDIPLTYTAMTERGVKGGLHHHFIIKNVFDIGIIISLWEHGKVHIENIYTDSMYDLAMYFVKGDSEKSEKDFTSSRNMKKPKIRYRIIQAERWTSTPRAKKHYEIIHRFDGFHDFSGFPYQEYVMVRRC